MDCSTSGFPALHHLPELAQTHIHWVSDAVQPSCPLSSTSPAFNLSQHQVFSSESALRIKWPKYQNFSFSISPSNEYSGLISFRMDWSDFLAVQGTLKSLGMGLKLSVQDLELGVGQEEGMACPHGCWERKPRARGRWTGRSAQPLPHLAEQPDSIEHRKQRSLPLHRSHIAGPLSLFLLVSLDLLCMKVSVRSFGFLLSQNALSLCHEEASGDNDRLLGRSVFKILRLHKRPGGEVL